MPEPQLTLINTQEYWFNRCRLAKETMKHVPRIASECNALVSINNEAVDCYNGNTPVPFSSDELAVIINDLITIRNLYDLPDEIYNFVSTAVNQFRERLNGLQGQ